jgi:hypothetical protein
MTEPTVSENEHERAAELLTWQVIGRLGGDDLAWLSGHLEACPHCRAEQRVQRRIRDAVASQPVVEFAPQAAFNRLWERIEADANIEVPRAPSAALSASVQPHAHRPARGWLKSLVAAQAAAIVLLGAGLWQGHHASTAAEYRTVTDQPGTAGAADEIKAIFADQVRLRDLKEILTGTNLLVTSGPNAAGVYTLVSAEAGSTAAARAALARLRADPRVRFAELTPRDPGDPEVR